MSNLEDIFHFNDEAFERLRESDRPNMERGSPEFASNLKEYTGAVLSKLDAGLLADIRILCMSDTDMCCSYSATPGQNVVFMNEKVVAAARMLIGYQFGNVSAIFPYTLFSYYWSCELLRVQIKDPAIAIGQRNLVALRQYSSEHFNGARIWKSATSKQDYEVAERVARDVTPGMITYFLAGHEIGHHCWSKVES